MGVATVFSLFLEARCLRRGMPLSDEATDEEDEYPASSLKSAATGRERLTPRYADWPFWFAIAVVGETEMEYAGCACADDDRRDSLVSTSIGSGVCGIIGGTVSELTGILRRKSATGSLAASPEREPLTETDVLFIAECGMGFTTAGPDPAVDVFLERKLSKTALRALSSCFF